MYTNSLDKSIQVCKTSALGWTMAIFLYRSPWRDETIRWANERLNEFTDLLTVNNLTKSHRGLLFLENSRQEEKQKQSFLLYIFLKILKSSKALCNIMFFCSFINRSYRYPLSLRSTSILQQSFSFLLLFYFRPHLLLLAHIDQLL